MNFLYVNVYAVTRHFGGPEEGGWWYNAGTPLASVPIRAKVERGHKDSCPNCRSSKNGELDLFGKPVEFCKQEPTEDQVYQWEQDNFVSELTEEKKDELFQTWINSLPEEFHMIPCDEEKWRLQDLIKNFEEMFADQKYGNIYSVRGGQDVQIRLEEEMAYEWPRRTPQYE